MNHLAVYEPTGLIPVASYARTSEDVRQRDGHGVRYQLRINERTARDHGCTVVAAYSDNGRSASRTGVVRPGFDTCRDCGRCSISGPLADQGLERLVFSEAPGHARPSESVHHRWRAGELQLEEKRKIITSVITCCVVRPGAKGNPAWDYSRVEPVWR